MSRIYSFEEAQRSRETGRRLVRPIEASATPPPPSARDFGPYPGEPWLSKRGLADALDMSIHRVEALLLEGLPHETWGGHTLRFKATQVKRWLRRREQKIAAGTWHRSPGRVPRPALIGEAAAYAAVILRDPCSYCGALSAAVDHIKPVAAGGEDHWSNLTGACASCNSSKNAHPLLYWLATRAA